LQLTAEELNARLAQEKRALLPASQNSAGEVAKKLNALFGVLTIPLRFLHTAYSLRAEYKKLPKEVQAELSEQLDRALSKAFQEKRSKEFQAHIIKQKLAEEALLLALALPDNADRASALIGIADRTKGQQQLRAIDRAIETAKDIDNALARGLCLARIVDQAPLTTAQRGVIKETIETISRNDIREWVLRRILELEDKDVGAERPRASVGSPNIARREEGLLPNDRSEVVVFPENPSRLWPGRPRGRPKSGSYDRELFLFIREVYGRYLKGGLRNQVRAYILNKDPKLYQAIVSYERRGDVARKLPRDIDMPSKPNQVQERLEKARRDGLRGLTKPERRSVLGKLLRMERQAGPKG
jgi:hypothetical protein